MISRNRNLYSDNNLLPLGMILGSSILVYIFLKKIYEKEVLIVDSTKLTLLKRFIFDRQQRKLDKTAIKDLKYLGREEFTDHPLDTKGFDYIGLGTGEREVQWFAESGNLTFNYKGSNFRFGKNIWEEEGTELIEKLKKYGCQQGV